jgi:hypothetical protein
VDALIFEALSVWPPDLDVADDDLLDAFDRADADVAAGRCKTVAQVREELRLAREIA